MMKLFTLCQFDDEELVNYIKWIKQYHDVYTGICGKSLLDSHVESTNAYKELAKKTPPDKDGMAKLKMMLGRHIWLT